jgi:hypothetical protein
MLAIFMALGISFDFLSAPWEKLSPIETQMFLYHFLNEKAIFQTVQHPIRLCCFDFVAQSLRSEGGLVASNQSQAPLL